MGNHVSAAVNHHNVLTFLLQADQILEAGVVTSQGAATNLDDYRFFSRLFRWVAGQCFLQTQTAPRASLRKILQENTRIEIESKSGYLGVESAAGG